MTLEFEKRKREKSKHQGFIDLKNVLVISTKFTKPVANGAKRFSQKQNIFYVEKNAKIIYLLYFCTQK